MSLSRREDGAPGPSGTAQRGRRLLARAAARQISGIVLADRSFESLRVCVIPFKPHGKGKALRTENRICSVSIWWLLGLIHL